MVGGKNAQLDVLPQKQVSLSIASVFLGDALTTRIWSGLAVFFLFSLHLIGLTTIFIPYYSAKNKYYIGIRKF